MLINFLFFLSGFTALVYELTWSRKLSLIFGTDSYGISTILAVFFTGLALGSFLFAKILKSHNRFSQNPLLSYAFLELGIGVFALLSPLIIALIKLAQTQIWQIFNPSFAAFSLITFLLSLIALIIPTTLMGATLPAIIAGTDKNKAGILYGLNTFGAVSGTLISGFILLRSIGINQTIILAAIINLLISLFAYRLSFRSNFSHLPSTTSYQLPTINYQLLILFSYFLSGFAAIALEVLFTRIIILSIGSSVYAFTIVLAVFLSGIALGSALSSKLIHRLKNPLFVYGFLQFILGLIIIFSAKRLSFLPLDFISYFQNFSSSFANLQFGIYVFASSVIFLPALMMGLVFPVILKILNADASQTGLVYSANTLGGVLGSAVTGFLLVPVLGTPVSVLIISIIYLAIGNVFIFLSSNVKIIKLAPFALTLILILFFRNFLNSDFRVLSSGLFVQPDLYKGLDRQEIIKKINKSPLIFQKEGISSLVTVKKDSDGNLNMQIAGKTDASTGSDMENQVLLGQLPLLLHPEAKDVLVIGLGSGITLGSVLSHPVEKVDVVEIEKEVVEAAGFFKEYNNNALTDPRVNMVVADGRNFLSAAPNKYDVISSEPSNPWQSGSAKLFTKDYFKQLKNASKDDGIVVHWVNMYAMGTNGIKSVIKAYLEVFPSVSAFGIPISNDIILLGSNKPVKLDFHDLEDKLKNENIKKDLAKASIDKPFEILARFYANRQALSKIAKDAAVNTDNFPYLEFQAPKKLYFSESENPWRMLSDNFSLISGFAPDAPVDQITDAEELRKTWVLTRIFYIEKNIGEGKIYAEKALSLDPDNPNLKSNLAQFYFDEANALFNAKSYQKAALSYEKSLSIKETPEAYYNLGQVHEDDNPQKARVAFEKAVSLDPVFMEALEHLGLIYVDEGNLNLAKKTYQKLLEIDPENNDAKEILKKLP